METVVSLGPCSVVAKCEGGRGGAQADGVQHDDTHLRSLGNQRFSLWSWRLPVVSGRDLVA